jgi:hypothetical protein
MLTATELQVEISFTRVQNGQRTSVFDEEAKSQGRIRWITRPYFVSGTRIIYGKFTNNNDVEFFVFDKGRD